jgi:hypothetical protein
LGDSNSVRTVSASLSESTPLSGRVVQPFDLHPGIE